MTEKTAPLQQVIYAELMPGCRKRYFALLECGHFFQTDSQHGKPKRRRCRKCIADSSGIVGYTISYLLKDWERLQNLQGWVRYQSRRYELESETERYELWRMGKNW